MNEQRINRRFDIVDAVLSTRCRQNGSQPQGVKILEGMAQRLETQRDVDGNPARQERSQQKRNQRLLL